MATLGVSEAGIEKFLGRYNKSANGAIIRFGIF